jgi:hypothetical protein
MTSPTTNTPTTENAAWCGAKFPFQSISEPGCYVCDWSGHLLRVPEDGVVPGRSPLINIQGRDQLFVTKISDNPYIALTKAKMLACNHDVNVNF